jgi:CheY-like chemotaxis protein
LNVLVFSMDKILRRTLSKEIEIKTTLIEGLGHVKADQAQLESALLNLALNARDSMPGGGKLMIETSNAMLDKTYVARQPFAKTGPHVCLSVTDTGSGIPEEIRERIFEPFFTTKKVGKGSGLGLSMIYGFVKQSGGHINVYSEDGHGTRFRIYLPRTDEPSAAFETGEVDADDLPKGTETVLLVEDDEQFRSTAVLLLEDLGYTVLCEPDGPSGLKSLKAHTDVDILFTDMVMPGGLNGHELAERAQEIRPGLSVLLTSGYPRDAFSDGRRFPLLSKPYTVASLARLLRAVLDRRQEQEE